MPPLERFIRTPQEWAHAATLLGKLNGTDWGVCMIVAHYTWGLQRESAEIGIAIFRERMAQKEEAIRLSLVRLTRKPADGGYGMIRVVHEQSNTKGRVLAIEDDWMGWAWDDEDHLARCALAMTTYRKNSRSEVSDWTPTSDAVDLATLLRQHCVGLVPEAEVPEMDMGRSRIWRRWLQQCEKMLEKRSPEIMGALVRYIHRDDHWGPLVFGEAADLRLARNLDQIHARWAAKSRR